MTSTDTATGRPVQIQFDDNTLLPALFGHHDEHLLQIERLLDVTLRYRGNQLEIQGPETSREIADRAIEDLYGRLKGGQEVAPGDVQAAVRMAASGNLEDRRIAIRTRKRTITPRSPVQVRYLEALGHADLTFGLGPAGTGKTYTGVALAVKALRNKEVKRIISVRANFLANTLDLLHEKNIEIVSPGFVNQRVYPPTEKFLVNLSHREKKSMEPTEDADELMFSKAEAAGNAEKIKDFMGTIKTKIKEQQANPGSQSDIRIKRLQDMEQRLKERLGALKDGVDSNGGSKS